MVQYSTLSEWIALVDGTMKEYLVSRSSATGMAILNSGSSKMRGLIYKLIEAIEQWIVDIFSGRPR